MKYDYINGDDWNALYGDGVLLVEGHDSLPHRYTTVLGIERHEVNADWMESEGRYPELLIDIPAGAYV